jgi:hypothetical protein
MKIIKILLKNYQQNIKSTHKFKSVIGELKKENKTLKEDIRQLKEENKN